MINILRILLFDIELIKIKYDKHDLYDHDVNALDLELEIARLAEKAGAGSVDYRSNEQC